MSRMTKETLEYITQQVEQIPYGKVIIELNGLGDITVRAECAIRFQAAHAGRIPRPGETEEDLHRG